MTKLDSCLTPSDTSHTGEGDLTSSSLAVRIWPTPPAAPTTATRSPGGCDRQSHVVKFLPERTLAVAWSAIRRGAVVAGF